MMTVGFFDQHGSWVPQAGDPEPAGPVITITHTDEDGTMISGSSKDDGVYEILRGLRGWRYWPSIRRIGISRSRFLPPQRGKIEQAARALRAAGFRVETDIAEDRMAFAEAEAARAEASEERGERLAAAAQRTGARAQADYERARQMGEAIPLGQPVMPDHYSYRRDMNYRARMSRTYDRAFEGMDQAEELARRAEAVTGDRRQENPGTTQRRIKGLEAELRGIEREISGGKRGHAPYVREVPPASGQRLARLEERRGELAEQIGFWRQSLEDRGARVWGKADFARGDFARGTHGWYEVIRANAQSLTVPDPIVLIGPGVEVFSVELAERIAEARGFGRVLTQTLPYDRVTARKSAEEMREEP